MFDILKRNHVKVIGNGNRVILFAHGFGCDQNAWNRLTSFFSNEKNTLILFDYVGAGNSDISKYDAERYSTLNGYATDLIEICEALKLEHILFVGHSVSCMIGALAAIRNPSLFSNMIFIGPSPRYINDCDYTGGFEKETIDELLEVMEEDYISWARSMAPAIMDKENGDALGKELSDSFCYIDPVIAKQFARTTFLSDNRSDLPKIPVPSLTIQCTHDIISPLPVAEYVKKHAPGNQLFIIEGKGHCPHMSHPAETAQAILSYID